jgi:CRP-like cAMP-binding protein
MSVLAKRSGAVRVLEADPELAQALPAGERDEATRALAAPVVALERGEWHPRRAEGDGDGRVGVLILSGLMTREIAIGDTVSAELLGPTDVIRPWDPTDQHALLPHEVRWQVLEPARLALLGAGFAQAAARWPALTTALVRRTVRRSHALGLAAAITCTTGLETRLLMLFWHLADRWGKVTADGVTIPVPLTHETIARLVGARRPSISTALKQLERDGRLARVHRGGWLLAGDPVGAEPPSAASAA